MLKAKFESFSAGPWALNGIQWCHYQRRC